jgi:hypothetical protein
MLTNPFGRKSNKVQKILKLGDQLSLSLRENVELIDTDDSVISFITESGNVIEGEFDFDTLEYSNIKVTSAEIFENSEVFDAAVTNNITDVLGSLLEDNRKEASHRFNKILHLWEARSKYDRVIERLNERKERYNLYASIVESEQFSVLDELKPQLIKFLVENKNELGKIREILNSIKLSNTISTAFNLPAKSVEDLQESTFLVTDRKFDSVYDIVCRQELIKKDLLENKKAFGSLWLNSNEVNSLVEFIGSKNDAKLSETLATIINDNPYFALATKKQLFELVENSLSFQDVNAFSKKEIKDFVSKIYEAKKDVKDLVVENLSQKYGINVQNLKTTPSFSELAKTQRVIFEALHKVAPRGSALKTALGEFSKVLGLHSGVDVIDLNEWIVDIFVDSDYSELINETSLLNYMNFDKVAGDLTKIGQVLKMIQAGMGGEMGAMGGAEMPEDGQYEADGSGEEDAMAAMQGEEEGGMEEEMPEEGEEEEEGMEDEAMPDDGEDGELPEESPEEAAMGAENDMEAEMGADEEGEEESAMEEDEFMSYLEDLEGLIDSLKANMGVGGDEEGMEGEEEMGDEEGMEEEMPEEGGEEEEMPEEEPEEDMEDEGEEEDVPPKKKKPFPPKE